MTANIYFAFIRTFVLDSGLLICYNFIGRCYQTVSGWPSSRGVLFLPSDFTEGGMLMTILDLIALLSFAIGMFQLGYMLGSQKKKK